MTAHTHLTRDMKPPGECPACDEYHRYVAPAEPYLDEEEPPTTPGQGSGWALAVIVGLCLLAGAFAVWLALRLGQILTSTP